MSDIIKMDYGMMADMSKTFDASMEQLQDTMTQMQSIATALEDGALMGRGGVAFTEAIRGKLAPALNRLTEKMQELSGDVKSAMESMQSADQDTAGMY